MRSWRYAPVLMVVAAAAQTPEPPRDSFLRTVLRDEWRIWSSPFRPSTYRTTTVRRYVAPFTLITGALIATDRKTAGALPNTQDQRVWSGRVSQLGAAYTLAGGAGATYLFGRFTRNERAAETGLLGLQAIAHTQAVVFALKQLSNRARPVQNSGGVGFWHGGDSFPSGHAATSFALATVVAYEYRDNLAAPIAAYSVAGLISASRVSARRHWFSDVFVGASTGFLIGRFVYSQNHRQPERARRLIPEVAVGRWGPGLYWSP